MKEIQVADEKYCEVGKEICPSINERWPYWCDYYINSIWGTKLREGKEQKALRCAQCKKDGANGVWQVWK